VGAYAAEHQRDENRGKWGLGNGRGPDVFSLNKLTKILDAHFNVH
jgi:hypothetical protein